MGRAGMGRPSKPTNLKLLEGDRKDRINDAEPIPSELEVSPTEELHGDALEVWERMAPDLTVKKVLTAWDADAFTLYCQSVAIYRQARAQLEEHGLTARGAAGGVIKSPYWQIMRDAAALMLSYGARFGLTPSDRAQLKVGGSDDESLGGERLLG